MPDLACALPLEKANADFMDAAWDYIGAMDARTDDFSATYALPFNDADGEGRLKAEYDESAPVSRKSRGHISGTQMPICRRKIKSRQAT